MGGMLGVFGVFVKLQRIFGHAGSWGRALQAWLEVCPDRAACAAASRAIGTRYGEQDT